MRGCTDHHHGDVYDSYGGINKGGDLEKSLSLTSQFCLFESMCWCLHPTLNAATTVKKFPRRSMLPVLPPQPRSRMSCTEYLLSHCVYRDIRLDTGFSSRSGSTISYLRTTINNARSLTDQ